MLFITALHFAFTSEAETGREMKKSSLQPPRAKGMRAGIREGHPQPGGPR